MTSRIQENGNTIAGWDGHAELHSIYEAMQHLTDTRRKQGKRYSMALVFTYLLLGKAAGETTLQAITEWVRLRGTWLQQVLPQAGPYVPCAVTYSNVLRAIDPAQLNEMLMDLLTRVRAGKRIEGEQEHVARDDKTLRGTQGHLPEDQKKMHQVSLYETQTGIVLAEQIVGDKENELSRINEFLKPQWIQGRIVSADALQTQHAFCLGSPWQEESVSCLPKGISRPCTRIFSSFFASRLSIVVIGEQRRRVPQVTGVWKCAIWSPQQNSMTFLCAPGLVFLRCFAFGDGSANLSCVRRRLSTGSPA